MAFFKKEKNEKKKGENAIGKIIYGFLLFAPLLAILSTVLYTTFNKNAYLSYESDTRVDALQQMVNDGTNSNIAANQTFLIKRNELSGATQILGFTQINIDATAPFTPNAIWIQGGGNIIHLVQWDFDNNIQLNNYNITNYTKNIDGILSGQYYKDGYYSSLLGYYNVYEIYDNKLNNVFYNAVARTEKSDLFNWAKDTGTYQVLETTTTGLGITNTFIPMLMTYWLLISVMYFIFDIALILVWAVHDKIHELKDSI